MARITALATGLVALVAVVAALIAPPALAYPGMMDWVKTWPAPSGQVTGTYIARAPSGDLYIGAQLMFGSGFALARYRESGSRRWAKVFASGRPVLLADVASDRQGNAVVAVTNKAGSFNSSWLVMKVSPAGKLVWSRKLGAAGSSPSGVAIDSSGNIYVAGDLVLKGHGTDFALVKYSHSGVRRWTRHINGDAYLDDHASSLAIGPDGRIYVAGWMSMLIGHRDGFIACYSAAGSLRWWRLWNRTGVNLDDRFWAIDVSKAGIAVAGQSTAANGDMRVLTCTYTLRGTLKGAREEQSWGDPGSMWRSVDIDSSGRVAVGGDFVIYPNLRAFAFARYDSGGSGHVAVYQPQGMPVPPGSCSDVKLSAGGAVYAVGSETSGLYANLALVRGTDDLSAWQTQYDDPSGGNNCWGGSLFLTPSAVFVSGAVGTGHHLALWKFER
jgi:hypothetical protein